MNDYLKKIVKNDPSLKKIFLLIKRHNLLKILFKLQIFSYFKFLLHFFVIKSKKNTFKIKFRDTFPILYEFKTSKNPVDYQYFYQFYWALELIKINNSENHIDIGSEIQFVGILSMFKKVTFLDIRELKLNLPNLQVIQGSVTKLPFQTESIKSVSILHVFEHLGLGRYGEKIDVNAYKKAANELERIINKNGKLYFSTTIGEERIQFNAQIVFNPNTILKLFKKFKLISFSVVDSSGNYYQVDDINKYEFNKFGGNDFELGLFEFEKK